MAADLADAGRGWRGRAGRAGGVWHPVRDSVRARAAAHARRRALLPLTGQAGIGCDAALAPRGLRLDDGQGTDGRRQPRVRPALHTMATALFNKLSPS